MKKTHNQRGAAIIVALFVVALVAAMATVMIQRFRVDVRKTELMLNANEAHVLTQSSLSWAIDQLNTNWQKKQPNQIVDKTPIHFPTQKQRGRTVSTTILDAQGFFNVNNLTEQLYQPLFTRLIQILGTDSDKAEAQNITAAIVDWISSSGSNAALDDYYRKLAKPYRSPHRSMASVTELRLVKGMSPELYSKLLPYVIALPQPCPININNADIPVLMSLNPALTEEIAKKIYTMARNSPFPTADAFLSLDFVKSAHVEQNFITVESRYFLVETNVKLGGQITTDYTLLERVAENTKTQTLILWQSKGTL